MNNMNTSIGIARNMFTYAAMTGWMILFSDIRSRATPTPSTVEIAKETNTTNNVILRPAQ